MNPQTKLPFKRYQIGSVFRDGPIKAGRYREFYQCDVDVVGVSSTLADAEIISLLSFVFKKLNLDVVIEINSRKLLEDIMEVIEIPKDKKITTIITIDKLKKIGRKEVKKELILKGIAEEKCEKLLEVLLVEGSNLEKLEKIKNAIGDSKVANLKRGVEELTELFSYLESFKVDYLFLPSLARGLGYYTGPIYEVFLKNTIIMDSSIAGGGRWDNMIGKYLNKEESSFPATGVSFGLEPIMEIIKKRDGLGSSTTAKLFVIPIGKENINSAISITQKIREQNIPTIIDLMNKSVSKNLDYADKLKIPFVGFLGNDEIKENRIKIKNLMTGKEELLEVSCLKDFFFK
jgi:histidyl-tRNA synthetase